MTATRHILRDGGIIGIPKSADFTLARDNDGLGFVATAPLTVTLPGSGVLGNGFECEVVNDSGGSVIIDGSGATNVTLSDGDVATIYESDGKQRVSTTTSTVVGDRFSEDTPWDPSVFGLNYDLVAWWDASAGVELDITTGNVHRWTDKAGSITATQGNVAPQPTLGVGEIRFDGIKKSLVLPTQGRAAWESKWWLILFRVNWTTMNVAGEQATYVFAMNGITGQAGQKQPQISLLPSAHQIQTQWLANSATFSVTVDVPGADDTWHSLITRRTDDHIYASIDGAAEVSVACYPRAFLGTGEVPTGWIGNGTGTTHNVMSIGFDTLLWGQRDISAHERAQAHAWALWKRGAEASLDASSPYLLAAPLMSLNEQHVAPPDSYADGYRFPGTWDDTVRGDTLDLTGYTRTFHDHFTALSTVTDGLTGAGTNWYAPAHIDTSGAKYRRPSQAPTDTFTLLPDNTTLQIKMQRMNPLTDPKPIYASGHIQTVDVWRNGGFTQAVPPGGASYFEARLAFNAIGTDDSGNIVTPAPSWNAFWLYTILDAKDSAVTKAELDIVEAYGDRDPSINEHHMSAYGHAAYRPQPGNAGSSSGYKQKSPSKITDMTQAPFYATPSLFDGQGPGQPGTFHTYGCKIDATWITYYFDGIVISRFPTYKEALGPLFILVSLQSQDLDPLGIPGQGGGTPNCTTYMWVDYVDAWSKS